MHSRDALGATLHLEVMKPKYFEKSATEAHDMELSISASRNSSLPIQEPKKNKPESHKFG